MDWAACVAGAVVCRANGVDLLGRKIERGRVEVALAGVVHDAVLDPVTRIALREHGAGKELAVFGREEGRREVVHVGVHVARDVQEGRAEAGKVECWGTGDDGVEGVRIALREGHRLPTSVGAAGEEGALGRSAVVHRRDVLGDFGNAMDGDVTVVDDPLQIVERPRTVDAVGLVSGVGAGGGIAAFQRAQRQRLILDRADEAAATTHDELAVPAARQPDRETDLPPNAAGELAVGHRVVELLHLAHRQIRQADGLECRASLIRPRFAKRTASDQQASGERNHGPHRGSPSVLE